MMVSFRNKLVVSIGILILGALMGFGADRLLFTHNAMAGGCATEFDFINPELDCERSTQKQAALSKLQEQLDSAVREYVESGKATRIGIFSRDLNSTRFVGVNQNEVFYMASLLKLPLVIGGFKLAEVEPQILEQQIPYDGKRYVYGDQIISPSEKLEAGKVYTVRDLMRRSVIYSDNVAAKLLYDFYPNGFMDRILEALGITQTRPEGTAENPVTARTYATVLRTLYNASYLTREYSNEVLQMHANTTFKEGAVAKLPKDVRIAHKFAERTVENPDTKEVILRQFHECGIVYAKDGKEPYNFCIMTEGKDYQQLQTIIQDISLDIYNAMSAD